MPYDNSVYERVKRNFQCCVGLLHNAPFFSTQFISSVKQFSLKMLFLLLLSLLYIDVSNPRKEYNLQDDEFLPRLPLSLFVYAVISCPPKFQFMFYNGLETQKMFSIS